MQFNGIQQHKYLPYTNMPSICALMSNMSQSSNVVYRAWNHTDFSTMVQSRVMFIGSKALKGERVTQHSLESISNVSSRSLPIHSYVYNFTELSWTWFCFAESDLASSDILNNIWYAWRVNNVRQKDRWRLAQDIVTPTISHTPREGNRNQRDWTVQWTQRDRLVMINRFMMEELWRCRNLG